MCGLAGMSLKEGFSEIDQQTLVRMRDSLQRRGPDAAGLWFNENRKVGLAHRRLSIQDLSEAGAQPMTSACERYTIAFNGEIYNAPALREKLDDNFVWRGHSDTEVILNCFTHYGIESSLKQFNGMFSIAVYDKKDDAIFLVRDRIGKKPLYYAFGHHAFIFASELKAFHRHPLFQSKVSDDALTLYFQLGYIPAPMCILQDAYKLRPGHMLKFCLRSFTVSNIINWHSARNLVSNWKKENALTAPEAESQLEFLVKDSVKQRLLADVEVGCLLSGGVDSTLVTALATRHYGKKMKTFTIGFEDNNYDETATAKRTAEMLGTEHFELRMSEADVLPLTEKMCDIYDEPFADSSQLPTTLVCQLASSEVKVALCGDGGDENFFGYERYLWASRLSKRTKKWPRWMRLSAASILEKSPQKLINFLYRLARRRGATPPTKRLQEKVKRLAVALRQPSPRAIYSSLISIWPSNNIPTLDGDIEDFLLDSPQLWPDKLPFARQFMYYDLAHYLPDDLQVKIDRASMFHSLECRAPLLDWRLAELSWRMPEKQMHSRSQLKLPLRNLLAKVMPEYEQSGPKSGFGIPLDKWLRGPLAQMESDLLNKTNLSRLDGLDLNLLESDFFSLDNLDQMPAARRWTLLMYAQWWQNWFGH